MASLFESIRSAPLSVVDDLVRDIRTTKGGLKRDLTPVGPWEGLDGELSKEREREREREREEIGGDYVSGTC